MNPNHALAEDPGAGHYLSVAIDRIGGKWKGLILYALMTRGPLRFNDLRRCLPKITHRVLTMQLRELEDTGLIDREVHLSAQLRVTYMLTQYGEALHPVMAALEAWGARGRTSETRGHYDSRDDVPTIACEESLLVRGRQRSAHVRVAT
ncbi:transcriptional regulator [Gluconacetobacter sacchari DSM 12717]|uniref:Helix-turn-helix transcriptional regulator n=2 Tax=Gluconacetobacter sacchari TaxID=92759 RepID=A0A7W4ID37_9PROT|nr:helix-turn-helix domain-containing protein [Gluconacetobacter sacchari]MBB2160643.1 helix-turn-helix transcriptional regulator [Gluconacetobacter sacchari]GBQ20950.1 transcriptional regulator [Gluconacetobacter sacchari DSM 12717]